jgi:hypothetical protein
MANYHVQVSLAAQSGETADTQVNTFAFISAGGLDSGSAGAYTDIIKAFYDALRGLGGLKGVAQNGHVVKYYNAVTTTPNYPLFTNGFNLTVAPGAIDLPLEVSLCVSFANDSETTVSPRRRRGRIYVSGWGEVDNTAGRPISGTYVGLADAYRDYAEAVNGLAGAAAAIWSRTTGELYQIERVWCDNEWDTMRSRGGKSTARETYMITP